MSLKARDPIRDLATFCKGQADSVWLCTPRELAGLPTVRVVLGGIASQQHMPLDRLDDLQLAVEMVLREELQAEGGALVLLVRAEENKLYVRIDGLTNMRLREALLSKERSPRAQASPLDVQLALCSLVEGYEVIDSGEWFAVQMVKRTR